MSVWLPCLIRVQVKMVATHVSLKEKSNFNPERGAIVVPKVGFKGLKMSKFEERSKNTNPRENVICKVSRVLV